MKKMRAITKKGLIPFGAGPVNSFAQLCLKMGFWPRFKFQEGGMKTFFAVFMALFMVACAGTPKMNRLSVGMTKAEAIASMGREPDSTSAQGGVEYLTYNLWRDFWDRRPGDYSDNFFVRLINGRVESYGRSGDFDSAKIPETKQTIDVNINK